IEPWSEEKAWNASGSSGSDGSEAASHNRLIGPGFFSRTEAVRLMHFPTAFEDIERARQRLALDEFVALQRQMKRRRQNLQTKACGIPCGGDNRLMKPFLGRLDFKLTEAQTRVLRDLRKELSGAHPMRRLLQGDVGSGKTI